MATSGVRLKLWLAVMAAVATVCFAAPSGAKAPKPPNVLVIVADDLGFSDLGAFGGEIRTPYLDALATRGLRLTGFHTAPTCSPTRAMLLTGADNHEVGLGAMAEFLPALPQLRGRPGYEGYLSRRITALPERLRAAGYTTLMSGKWHLGLTADTSPAARGFDRSFALLQGAHDHFGDDQGAAWAKVGQAVSYREDGRLTTYPAGRYSADVFTDRMLGFLREAKSTGKPFFAYLTYTAPHWPLQAPDEDIARYKGRYDAGYGALRQQRLAKMKALGLIPAGVEAAPFVGVKPWSELTDEERARSSRSMEVYAAMVDRMDQNIGRVLAALKANGELDHTIIVFLSDNGADSSLLHGPFGATPDQVGHLALDDSLANLGRRGSYASYGPGWAQAATAPGRMHKGTTYQGGIHAPAIVAGPGVPAGRSLSQLLHVADIAPTVLAWADPSLEEKSLGAARPGRSWLPLLSGLTEAVRGPDDTVGWELFGYRALRQGDWKLVLARTSTEVASGTQVTGWQLFNLKDDPAESHDLAAEYPGQLEALVAAWNAYAVQAGVYVAP